MCGLPRGALSLCVSFCEGFCVVCGALPFWLFDVEAFYGFVDVCVGKGYGVLLHGVGLRGCVVLLLCVSLVMP